MDYLIAHFSLVTQIRPLQDFSQKWLEPNDWIPGISLSSTSKPSYQFHMMRVLELCAGGGGQALGIDQAGFETAGLIEIERIACDTLQLNRPKWNVVNADLRKIDPKVFKSVDIICGGVPCQPFSIAGKKFGELDERDLFPEAIRFVSKIRPLGFFFENVRGLASSTFSDYRETIVSEFLSLGYQVEWRVLEAADFGVAQLRPRFILVGSRRKTSDFPWPDTSRVKRKTVSQVTKDLMGQNCWKGLDTWIDGADRIGPTIVGGSKKHGGPDLGPTRAKQQWADMGIDGMQIANEAPDREFVGNPRLTNAMVARLQGFPDKWKFAGTKTTIYRQIGNAFPPPVAKAVSQSMLNWLTTDAPVSKRKSKAHVLPQEL